SLASFGVAPVLMMARDTTTLLEDHARLVKAQAALKDAPLEQRQGLRYMVPAFHAYLTLARGDTAAALKEFDAIPSDFLSLPTDQLIRARLLARTDPKRALELLEGTHITGDIISVARELEIGRMAERANDL